MKYPEFEKIVSLFVDKATNLASESWIGRAMKSNHANVQELLATLEGVAKSMDAGSRGILAWKFAQIIPNGATVFSKVWDAQFLDAIVEMLGYCYLQRRYREQLIKFLEPPGPDLAVYDSSSQITAVVECKNFHQSNSEREYFRRQAETGCVESRDVNHCLESTDPGINPFLRKLQSDIERARGQLESVNLSGIAKLIFVNFSLDASATVLKSAVISLISEQAARLQESGIELIAVQEYDLSCGLC